MAEDDAARARADPGVRSIGSKHIDGDDVRQHRKPNRARRAPDSDASALCADGAAPLPVPHGGGGPGSVWFVRLELVGRAEARLTGTASKEHLSQQQALRERRSRGARPGPVPFGGLLRGGGAKERTEATASTGGQRRNAAHPGHREQFLADRHSRPAALAFNSDHEIIM